MKWERGEVSIAKPPPGMNMEDDPKCFEWATVSALVSGPLALHEIYVVDGESWGWTLTHRGSGGAIKHSQHDYAFWDLLALAERIVDLDWSGSAAEFCKRNGAAVKRAFRDCGFPK